MGPVLIRYPWHFGSALLSARVISIALVSLVVVLAGCSGITLLPEEDDKMALMNHTATGVEGGNMSMNDTTGTGDAITTSELVTFENQTSNGSTVTIQFVRVPDGGYVTVYTTRFTEDRGFSTLGVTPYLEPGNHSNVTVTLYDVPGRDFSDDAHLMGERKLIAVPHRETTDDRTFDHISTGLAEDVPYRNETGAIGVDTAIISVDKDDS